MHPKYSVIVPVCHGGRFLHTALSTLARVAMPHGGVEVLVVGDGPDALAPEATGEFAPEFRFLKHSGCRSAALNAACAAARGEIWVFADDDCSFPADWLLRIERALHDHPRVAVIGGRDELPAQAGLFDRALDHALNSFVGTGGIRTGTGLRAGRYYPKLWNMTIRADAARKACDDDAWFDPDLAVHEDVELIERIARSGAEVAHVPEVVVGHYRDTTFPSFFLRNLRMARVCRERGIHRRAHLALASFFAAVPLAGLAAAASPALGFLFILPCAAYGTALGATGFACAWKSSRPALAVMVPALVFALHLARAIGYCLTPTRKEPRCTTTHCPK
jgi:glycosyltransferase involved in cell wall biosynthesis